MVLDYRRLNAIEFYNSPKPFSRLFTEAQRLEQPRRCIVSIADLTAPGDPLRCASLP
jgi:hypothetical protein